MRLPPGDNNGDPSKSVSSDSLTQGSSIDLISYPYIAEIVTDTENLIEKISVSFESRIKQYNCTIYYGSQTPPVNREYFEVDLELSSFELAHTGVLPGY